MHSQPTLIVSCDFLSGGNGKIGGEIGLLAHITRNNDLDGFSHTFDCQWSKCNKAKLKIRPESWTDFLLQCWCLVVDHLRLVSSCLCLVSSCLSFQHHASHLPSVPFLAGLAVTSHEASVATILFVTVH